MKAEIVKVALEAFQVRNAEQTRAGGYVERIRLKKLMYSQRITSRG